MPALRFCGRRCALATDDFVFIGAFGTIIFLPWLGWVPVICASYFRERFACDDRITQHLLDVALPGLSALFISNWIISVLLVIFSSRGTLSNPEPRRHVGKLVIIDLFICFFDFVLAILGTVLLVRDSYCDIIGVYPVIKVCTIFLWVLTAVRFFMIIAFYDWSVSKRSKEPVTKDFFTSPVRRGTLKKWNLRMQTLFLWCTTPSEARRQALRSASELLALLSCDLDLVASDLLAGHLLYRQKCLSKYQSEKAKLNSDHPITATDGSKLESFPPDDFPQWMNFRLAKRYCQVGLGVLGWQWFLYRHLSCGCCLLMKRFTCLFPWRARSRIVHGDNCCGCGLAGLLGTSHLPFDDLLHVSFVDSVFEVPFFVTFDHETRAVVVTARGTMSMDDVLTDVAAEFAIMDDPGLPPDCLAHAGMLAAAREIKKKLDEAAILEEAFAQKPDYNLVLTGHSLGASVATLLTALYLPKYPNLQCFAYAPAPTMNKVALQFTRDHIFTLIYGNDAVCFLSYENVKIMVNEMVECLKECKRPKHQVFLNSEKCYQATAKGEDCCTVDIKAKSNGIKERNGTKEENGVKVEHGITKEKTVPGPDIEKGTIPPVTEKICVAGRIVHIRFSDKGYRVKIATSGDYCSYIIRPRHIFDHFPQFIEKVLDQLGDNDVLKSSEIPPPKKKKK